MLQKDNRTDTTTKQQDIWILQKKIEFKRGREKERDTENGLKKRNGPKTQNICTR